MYVHVANGLLCVHGYTLVQVYSQPLFVESKLDIEVHV